MIGLPLMARVDDVLRGRSRAGSPSTPGRLAACVVAFGTFYGGVMGTFGGVAGERPWQVLDSAIKVPLLLLATLALGLPSFFVLNTLLGVRADFGKALGALLASQAVSTIVLASLAPFTALWYASSRDYSAAVLFNAVIFGVSAVAAQGPLRRGYRPLIAGNRVHLILLRVWLVLYAFIGIQMGWLLRPFVGDPLMPVRFFRGGAWENAYVIVGRMIWGKIAG